MLTLLTLTLSAAALAGAGGEPPPAHLFARINDPRSHGQLGDSLLSLNEFILLNKRALTVAQLSPGEQGQIYGFGSDIAYGDIDFRQAPKITCERGLDTIEDMQHGFVLTCSTGVATIDLNGTRGFIANSNFADFRNLVIENAAIAITLTQTNAFYGTVINGVTFQNLTTAALVAVMATSQGNSKLEIGDTRFVGVPSAIEVFDLGQDRLGNFWFHDVDIRNGQRGIAVQLGPGGANVVLLERVTVIGTQLGISFGRATASDSRMVVLNGLHVTTTGGATGFSFQGHPTAADALTMHMFDLAGSTHGLRLWPLGSQLQATFADGRLGGPVELLTGTGAGAFVANARVRNGSVDVGSTGAAVRITDTIFEQTALQTAGTTAVQVDASRFVGGSAGGQPAAHLNILTSHLNGVALGAHASVTASLPAAHIGSMDATPLEPKIGTSLVLQADLPPRLWGIWIIGLAETLPYLGPPVHVYFWLQFHAPLPIVVRNQAQTSVPVPLDPSMIGWDFVAQLVVLPDAGMVAPPLSLPPGRRFVVR